MNLHFAAAAHGIRGRRNRDLVEWHIERYGLSEYRRTSWKALSGGYRLRFELVKALVSNPRLLVLDEPLASLDIIARQDFLRDLRAIAYSVSCPIPILITSQHIYEIDAIADQVIVLDSGKCLFMGSLSEMEQQSTSRFFEVNTSLSRRLIQQRVRRIGMTIRNAMSDGYIIECSKDIHREHALASLTSTLGSDMLGIRDITGSSRRFFIDANQVEN
jgi:ABC-type multidrug transport system ATPase subunit